MTRDESIRYIKRLRYAKRYNRAQQAHQTRLLRAAIGTKSDARAITRCVKRHAPFFTYWARYDDQMVRAFRALVQEATR